MTADDMTLLRNPHKKTGKAHHRHAAMADSTACGKGTRDMTEVVPVLDVAFGDLCQKCGKAVPKT